MRDRFAGSIITVAIAAAGVGAALKLDARQLANALGIAGFHDLEMGRLISPTLTTVHVPAFEIGRRAGEVIRARLSDDGTAEAPDELPFRIIRRESTRPA